MSGHRITKAEMERRVTEIYKMVVAGLPRRDIFRICREKHGWDVCDRQLATYLQRAEQLLEKESEPVRGVELGKALARYTTQYAKADARKDHRGAALIEDKIVNLLGLSTPAKLEITGKGGGPIRHEYDFSKLSDVELEDLILREAAGIARRAPEKEEPVDSPSPD